MPRTELLPGIPLSKADGRVLRALLQIALPSPAGTEFRVAVKNEAGEIYRLIKLYGLKEKANFEEAMRGAGFDDERAVLRANITGYDCVYRNERAALKKGEGRPEAG